MARTVATLPNTIQRHDRTEQGGTPLHYAASHNPNVEVLKYFVNYNGANINAKDNNGKTPLDVADIDEKRRILEQKTVKFANAVSLFAECKKKSNV
ncbi:MAG: ankyrin repeat domain-containing protein [Planctomycetaceae bacterium]|jgi:hypothetical protein|nr:ankyrin repeat domain-containing protein [Planctomycetaceae bacterium]